MTTDPALLSDAALVALLWVALILILVFVFNGLWETEPVETEASHRALPVPGRRAPSFEVPERVSDAIGRYLDAPIWRSVVIGGVEYQFDHVAPPEADSLVAPGEHYVAPGLVYRLKPRAARR